MLHWLIVYAEQFGKEFPLLAVKDKPEYEILQIVMYCCTSGEPYEVEAKPAVKKRAVRTAKK